MTTTSAIWRCQCPEQCEDDGMSCYDDVSQEDFLCDYCRANCRSAEQHGTEEQGRDT